MTVDLLGTLRLPDEVRMLDADQLEQLCAQIRLALVRYGKQHGGHIGSNLGLVEACVALHAVFDSPRDRIVFDVSHQSYVHKILTGRASAFVNEEQFDTVTGFTNPQESEHDQFVLGHTGTAVSLATGLAKMRDMNHDDYHVVAVLGDGALSSAVAFEGLNNAAEQGGNIIIVFNDNEMSIAENHGGMYGQLARLRESQGTAQPNLFEALGLDYRYVEHGNDVHAMIQALREVKDTDHPVVLHIHTCKGLGLDQQDAHYGVLEGRCEANHWQNPLAQANAPLGSRKTYGRAIMAMLEQRFDEEPGLMVISPATPGSNGITREFRERAGAHYIDTGITEEHAVTFASGVGKAGGRPVVATSATFFQRTVDQLQQEVALNHTPVTLLEFSGGLSDADNTHSGAFDIAMFGNIPGLLGLAPTSGEQLLAMVDWATSQANDGPVMIRVPGPQILDADRAQGLFVSGEPEREGLQYARNHTLGRDGDEAGAEITIVPQDFRTSRVIKQGRGVAVLALGNTMPLGRDVVDMLAADDANAIEATLVDPVMFSDVDETLLRQLAHDHSVVVTLEDAQLEGGWGAKVTRFYEQLAEQTGTQVRVVNVGAEREFTDRVALCELNERYGLTTPAIVHTIRNVAMQTGLQAC
ncbi:1-deoxy-D-xylulose-5-phosphate synthase [Bifidobacterium gallicum]|uniref:1-deoxy-D-xylulose-5-phosphate synthase n=1 Tax=Bifidobacterium gallicum DSM 20093 = LMG 11596 TaxID=561180 RepID=D1NUR0_9BIFI|nr:1-deoxy-D-xylulose-5-phosphate synthase [Bifidobacterium gallicum]EFA22561.1 putative 1-deoxy-D-xylulose-5-phosphate synthase [Bifidobacterium gallicum DSM 20093 = LMG 11596]KFI59549.1 1-deoxy-D-xylulose-5-phosphate synthase [Bifidobacterium gallicum DSM 20093 = LMG 11596]